MSKLSNTLTMLELLNNNRKYSVKELSEILEVTDRMVRIYKQDLEKAGIYIDTIKGPYGGYILSHNILLPQRGFSKYDILLLNTSYEFLKQNNEFLFNKEYIELVDKVDGIYKSTKKKSVNNILKENDNKGKYNILSKAIKEKKKVWINFLSLNKDAKERVIHPCNLFLYNDDWYVSAFCELRGEIRHFSLPRIIEIKLLEESYKN